MLRKDGKAAKISAQVLKKEGIKQPKPSKKLQKTKALTMPYLVH